MSTIYEQLLVNLTVGAESLRSDLTCVDALPPPSMSSPQPPRMDKSVFSRVLKVIIQCVEEGSALLHTFKMEGDISNTRITIEFQSSFGAAEVQPPSHLSDPQSPRSDRRNQHSSARPSSTVDHVPDSSGITRATGSSAGSWDGRSNVSKHSMDNSRDSPEKPPTPPPAPNQTVPSPPLQQSNPLPPPKPAKPSTIPNGVSPKQENNKKMSERYSSSPKLSRGASTDSNSPAGRRKKGPRTGALLDQVIQDQNNIPTLAEAEDDDDGDDGWPLDRNQNTLRRKNQNGVAMNGQHVPIDANVVVLSSSPKMAAGGPQLAQIMSRPSVMNRLTKMSEKEQYHGDGSGDSDMDSGDSEEDDEDEIIGGSSGRQYSQRSNKKLGKRRKGLISL